MVGQTMLSDRHNKRRIIDLTHAVHETIPARDAQSGFCLNTDLDYQQCTGQTQFRVQSLCMKAGFGTHIDAPAHCFKNKNTVDLLPLESLIAQANMIDVRDRAQAEYAITVRDIELYEQQFGPIVAGNIVLFNTGWGMRWSNPVLYRNADASGNMHFPALSNEAAALLVERRVVGVGIDTLSPDGGNYDFPVHRTLLFNDIVIIENVANLNELPPHGFEVFCLPIKIAGATEAPVRLLAII